MTQAYLLHKPFVRIPALAILTGCLMYSLSAHAGYNRSCPSINDIHYDSAAKRWVLTGGEKDTFTLIGNPIKSEADRSISFDHADAKLLGWGGAHQIQCHYLVQFEDASKIKLNAVANAPNGRGFMLDDNEFHWSIVGDWTTATCGMRGQPAACDFVTIPVPPKTAKN